MAPGRSTAALSPSEIEQHTLSNGMKVLLWHDESIPNLAIYTFWRVGSRNEAPGITGLAHFFEHMMFNGSRNYAPGEFDRTMEAAGGANNAYTSENITVYTDWFPSDALELMFDLEADRLRGRGPVLAIQAPFPRPAEAKEHAGFRGGCVGRVRNIEGQAQDLSGFGDPKHHVFRLLEKFAFGERNHGIDILELDRPNKHLFR